MSDAVADPSSQPARKGKKTMILALLLAVLGASGGFFAVSSGLIPGVKTMGDQTENLDDSTNHKGEQHLQETSPKSLGDIAFVEVDPITISLNASQSAQHLRFHAQLEVSAQHERDVMMILPRVTDVMNSYLRALKTDDLTGPMALTRLRAQLLRRIQVVTGTGRVRDLLVMEFVLN